MIRCLLILGIACGAFCSQAQSYSVIHVLGKIYDIRTKSYLRPGVKLDATSSLKFETPEAKAAVLSPSKGRFILQQSGSATEQHDLVYTLSALITPVKGRLSTRAGAIAGDVDPVKKFSEGPVAFIGDRYAVTISPVAFPMNATRYFYATFMYRNERINKRLYNRGDTLIFERPSFFSVDGRPVDPLETSDHELIYMEEDLSNYSSWKGPNFVLVSDADLSLLADGVKDMKGQERIAAVQELIASLYGAVTEEEVRLALKRLGK